ncbi:MAG: hypothetical protein H7Y04_15615, partial [Verrucomicrobia bacterium]|nr:hypothetical protein [Cytophagales bacterium]
MKKLVLLFIFCWFTVSIRSQSITSFGKNTGEFSPMLENLYQMMKKQQYKMTLDGKERVVNVGWIRDETHVLKAMKYWQPEMKDVVEFFLEKQKPEGLFMDYIYPIEDGVSNRSNFFEPKYCLVLPKDKKIMHRLPVEADVEYLMVEAVLYIWQATGDESFIKKWLPALEKGLLYMMSDPARWSKKYQLVKRGYTIDTWDFMILPMTIPEYAKRFGDPSRGIMNITDTTRMGIMHGDNSGLYAACRQVSQMHKALKNEVQAQIWEKQA